MSGSSATLTTTHLPQLRATLDEWHEKQPAPKPFTSPMQDFASRLSDDNAVGVKQGKDIVVAFRTRPPLPNEAEEKFHASESKEEATSEGQTTAELSKVEFCSGVTAVSAEPGTFVCHVPGFKVRTVKQISIISRAQGVLVVWTDSYAQDL